MKDATSVALIAIGIALMLSPVGWVFIYALIKSVGDRKRLVPSDAREDS